MRTLATPSDAAELRARLERVGPSSERRWGRMTPHEMVVHLADAFRVSLGEREAKPLRLRVPRWAARLVAFYVPMPWPRDFPAPRGIGQDRGGSTPEAWEVDLRRLEQLLDRFVAADGAWPEHPTFGRLSSWEWRRWGWLHTDHHLRQFGA